MTESRSVRDEVMIEPRSVRGEVMTEARTDRGEVMTEARTGQGQAEVRYGTGLGLPASASAIPIYTVDRELIARTRLGSASSRLIWPTAKYRGYPWLGVWTSYETSPRRVQDESNQPTTSPSQRRGLGVHGGPSHGGRAHCTARPHCRTLCLCRSGCSTACTRAGYMPGYCLTSD